MISREWITAWLISLIAAAGAYVSATRGRLPRMQRVLYAAVFFPAPLFVAVGGVNSFVYLFDLVVPLWLITAYRRAKTCPPRAHEVAGLLILSLGVIPAFVCGVFGDRGDFLLSVVTVYRITGAMAVMLTLSASSNSPRHPASLLGAFSWLCIVLAAAMILQGNGLISSNVYYAGAEGEELAADVQYMVAGLFRASLGIVAMLGISAYLAQLDEPGSGLGKAISLIGAISALLIIVLSGSKTSLLCVPLVVGIYLIGIQRRGAKSWARMIAVVVVFASLAYAAAPLFGGVPLIERTLGVLSLEHASLSTLELRQLRWQDALARLNDQPSILAGIQRPGESNLNIPFFHNEYLGALMVGGLWSGTLYVTALICLVGYLARAPRRRSVFGGFAALVLCVGLVQGLTVAHLNPGLFFVSTTAMFGIAYGLGCSREAASTMRSAPAALRTSEGRPTLPLPSSRQGI